MTVNCQHPHRWRAWDRSEIYCPDCLRVFTDSELEDAERAKIPTAKPPIGTYDPENVKPWASK